MGKWRGLRGEEGDRKRIVKKKRRERERKSFRIT